jgi:hypothetical protein
VLRTEEIQHLSGDGGIVILALSIDGGRREDLLVVDLHLGFRGGSLLLSAPIRISA